MVYGCPDGMSRDPMTQWTVLPSRVGALVLALAVPTAVLAQDPVAPSLVFDGVTVVDVEHGSLAPDQRVVITGNRIAAVGPVAQLQSPEGARVVDARGK